MPVRLAGAPQDEGRPASARIWIPLGSMILTAIAEGLAWAFTITIPAAALVIAGRVLGLPI